MELHLRLIQTQPSVFSVAISPPKAGNRILQAGSAFVRFILMVKPSALLRQLSLGFAVALPRAPTSPKEQEWNICVNNSKKHLTKRFMGQ